MTSDCCFLTLQAEVNLITRYLCDNNIVAKVRFLTFFVLCVDDKQNSLLLLQNLKIWIFLFFILPRVTIAICLGKIEVVCRGCFVLIRFEWWDETYVATMVFFLWICFIFLLLDFNMFSNTIINATFGFFINKFTWFNGRLLQLWHLVWGSIRVMSGL